MLSAEAPQLDPVVIRPVAEQDEELHELFARYAVPLERFCMRELGNREEAEDAVQTTFLNAFRAFRRGVRPELEAAWLYAIAANVCRSRRRSFFRRRRVEVDDDLHALEDVIAAPQALETEMLIGLGDALASMPESQRTAILLREWQGLSYAEIAREMNLTNGAVETLIFRARRTLAKGLEEEPSRRKKIAGGINVGSLLSALKGLLGGAGAAKLAAAGTVAVVATFAAAPLAHHLTPPDAPATPESPAPVPPVTPGTTGRGAEVQRNMTPPATALRTGPTRTLTLAGTKADSHPTGAKQHAARPAAADVRAGGADASSSTASAGPADSADVAAGTTRPAGAGQNGRTHPNGAGAPGRANARTSGSSGTVPPTSNGNGARGNAQNPPPPGQAKKPATPPGQAQKPASPPGQAQTPPGQQKQTGGSGSAGGTANANGATSGKDTSTGNEAGTAATETPAATGSAPAAGNGNSSAPAGNGTGGGNSSSSGAANNGANGNAAAGSNAGGSPNASAHGKP